MQIMDEVVKQTEMAVPVFDALLYRSAVPVVTGMNYIIKVQKGLYSCYFAVERVTCSTLYAYPH